MQLREENEKNTGVSPRGGASLCQYSTTKKPKKGKIELSEFLTKKESNFHVSFKLENWRKSYKTNSKKKNENNLRVVNI